MAGAQEILVGIDGSAHERAAIAWAMAEARTRKCGVLLVHVSQPTSELWATTPSFRHGLRDLARPIVDHALGYAASLDPDVAVRGQVVLGNPHHALVDMSATAVLTVVGRRGRGRVAANLVGSLSRTLMARCYSPVVAVAPDADPTMQPVGRVVVALGDLPASPRALEFGIAQARRHLVELCVLHAWKVPDLPPGHLPCDDAELRARLGAAEATRLSAMLAASAVGTTGVQVRPIVLAGSPVQVLRKFCVPSDLLVLGHHRHGRCSPAALSPVISGALHQVHCAVATVGDVAGSRAVAAPARVRSEQPMASGVLSY